jgi:membrane associated rhomboid family serine protease
MIPIKDNILTDRLPFVTIGLILANVVIYLLAILHGGSLFSGPDAEELVKFGATPYALTHPGVHCGLVTPTELSCGRGVSGLPAWQTVFTSMFMHASIVHLAGNMVFLWIFGNTVEDSMGPFRFLAFYLLGGIAALGLQVAIDPDSLAPTVGASGAIAAVLGGYIVLHPRGRVLTLVLIIFFFGVIEIPALAMLGLWFIEQAVFGAVGLTNPTNTGGAAYFASVGGFVFGLLAIRVAATRRKPTPPTAAAYR